MPNEAIYSQTLKRLKDRQHPYRQALDRAAAGRVRIMEKGDRLDARDVESQLCVMVLMLQAANRQTQETLRMFRDRGDVHGFFPPEGDQLAHAAEKKATPNLDGYDPTAMAKTLPENPKEVASQLQRISLTTAGEEHFAGETVAKGLEALRFDPAYAVRVISDLVPNPFVAREIVEKVLAVLRQRGFDDSKIGAASGLIVDELRKALDKERDSRAEALFKAEVAAGTIQFRLRLDGRNWHMPHVVQTTEAAGAQQLTGGDGAALRRSLFSPVYRAELNEEERGVAVHLDGEAAVKWWHRNVARADYGLQGWKRGRIYPDFIFATGGNAGKGRVVVLETKGDHLQNPDTDYKRAVLSFLTTSFSWDSAMPAGQLQIEMTGETVECALVLMQDIPTTLPSLVQKP